jgi:YidC/Oxa1 family membrane protein insertase
VIWDSLLKGLGSVLSFFYEVIPSYGVAIILLTIVVRIALIPLTIRQTRSMQAMQRLQPRVKELQRKYKGNRQKLNEELMKLYKEHQVNPLGGCLPLLLQLPVFFALFSVLRSTIPVVAVPTDTTVQASAVPTREAVCHPNTRPTLDPDRRPTEVACEVGGETRTFAIDTWEDEDGTEIQPPPFLFRCAPEAEDPDGDGPQAEVIRAFQCTSPLGTKHIPRDSSLFADVVDHGAPFLGMELSCSPLQAASEVGIRQCGRTGATGGPVHSIPYFVLVALMVGSTWYQQRQMQQASAGPGQQQAQLMGRIMPVFLGFISLQISAGVLVYWVTTNGWQVGQQHIMLRSRAAAPAPPTGSAKSGKSPQSGKGPGGKGSAKEPRGDGSRMKGNAGSRKKRRKR